MPNLLHLYLYKCNTIYYGDHTNSIKIKQNNKIDKLIEKLNEKYPNLKIEKILLS
ncbi:MAG: hypothetical protein KIT69_15945 [Propionibacteriaceae bacterium]|nr:hypothetical protein [Propionibacteriaceae bacterium]